MNPNTTLLVGQWTMTIAAFLLIAGCAFFSAVFTYVCVSRTYEQLLALYGLRRVEQALAKEDGDPDSKNYDPSSDA